MTRPARFLLGTIIVCIVVLFICGITLKHIVGGTGDAATEPSAVIH